MKFNWKAIALKNIIKIKAVTMFTSNLNHSLLKDDEDLL